MPEPPASVDAYIDGFPVEVQDVLRRMREAIRAAVPGLTESISYGIPTMRLGGSARLSFAGWAAHVSVYPVPDGDADFQERIATYRSGKSTLKFPLGAQVPYDLVGECATLLARQRS